MYMANVYFICMITSLFFYGWWTEVDRDSYTPARILDMALIHLGIILDIHFSILKAPRVRGMAFLATLPIIAYIYYSGRSRSSAWHTVIHVLGNIGHLAMYGWLG
ncbi:unnamed protein product [Choristocarpus tenellus]